MANSQVHRATDGWRTGIIGCGNIGSLLDESQDGHPPILTHASAILNHPSFSLIALCDPDSQRLEMAGVRRGVSNLSKSIAEFLKSVPLDVISLCAHPEHRMDFFNKPKPKGLQAIICEKPLAANLNDALIIKKYLNKNSEIIFLVNYSRRFNPTMKKVREIIRSEQLGLLQRAQALYGKGLANNGSHLIDMMNFFFGKPESAQFIQIIDDDRVNTDFTAEARIIYSHGKRRFPFTLLPLNHLSYTLFELDLLFENGRIQAKDRGFQIEISRVVTDRKYHGYNILASSDLFSERDYSFENVYSEVAKKLKGGKGDVSCSFEDALLTLSIVETIKSSKSLNGKELEILCLD